MTKCKKHPTYKAIRKPTADCEQCQKMWEEAEAGRAMTTEPNMIQTQNYTLYAVPDMGGVGRDMILIRIGESKDDDMSNVFKIDLNDMVARMREEV